MRARALVLSALVGVVLVACSGSDATTRVVVRVEAGPLVRARTAALRLRVEGHASDAVQREDAFEQTLLAGAFAWPAHAMLVPRGGDASRSYRLEVSALDTSDRPIAIARAWSGFVPGQTRELVLWLGDACLEVISCAVDQTCIDGGCHDARIDPLALDELGAADRDGGRPGDGACATTETYADEDGDGYGATATREMSCGVPEGRVTRDGDCDDACPTCHPGRVETCDGARDEDCDGTVDEGCACHAGETRACPGASDVGACVAGTQTCVEGVWSVCEGRVDPLPETCDGVDEDCDGRIDEGVHRACEAACGSGTQLCRDGAWQACSAPAPRAETCDGTDEDCDGRIDEGVLRTFYRDADGDGYGADSMTALACAPPAGYVEQGGDCDEGCPTCSPAGTETCDGARDEDCDGAVDEGCACTSGTTRPCPGGTDTGECVAGRQTCTSGAWGACVGQVGPRDETCNGRDDDCDGRVDEAISRECGPSSEVGVCRRGTQVCSAGSWDVCRGAISAGTEACNGLDDDCDGIVDESVCMPDAGAGGGAADAGAVDAGAIDAGTTDAGTPVVEPADAGIPDPLPSFDAAVSATL